jgi:hypothetical protein
MQLEFSDWELWEMRILGYFGIKTIVVWRNRLMQEEERRRRRRRRRHMGCCCSVMLLLKLTLWVHTAAAPKSFTSRSFVTRLVWHILRGGG